MNPKKIWTVFVACMLVASMLIGCTQPQPSAPPAENPPPEAANTPPEDAVAEEPPAEGDGGQYPDFKVAALLSGVITDNGWSANMYDAVMQLSEKYGVVADYVESIAVSDMEEHLRGYAGDGYNLVIAHGSQFIDVVNSVAGDYPDTIFTISYAAADVSEHPNVACVAPVNNGFLMGIVAGALTETNKVALLGSEENPSISMEIQSFGPGVKLVNPDAEVITGYIGSATDLDKGKEMAMNLINSGVDVVGHSANSAGLGVLQAAEEAGILAVGINTDQYESAPGAVVTSSMRNFPAIYDDLFKQIVAGGFQGGLYAYGIGKDGCQLAPWHGWDETLPSEKIELIESTIQDIKDGKIEEKVIWE